MATKKATKKAKQKSKCCNDGSILEPGRTCSVCGTANWVVGWTSPDDGDPNSYPITELHDASDNKIGPRSCTYIMHVQL